MEERRSYGIFQLCSVCISIFVLSVLSPNANAQIFSEDLTMHSTTTSTGMMGQGGGTTTGTEYYSQNAMRMNQSDGNDTIIRFDSEKLVTIDNNKKTYTEMTFADLEQMLNKANAQLSSKSEEMAGVMKMMGMTDASFSVTKAGTGETIEGYPTEKYLLKGGIIEQEIMAATSLKIPAAYYDALKMQVPSIPMFDMKKLLDEMKKVEGFPLKTVTNIKIMNMEMKTSKVVTSIEKGAIPASTFENPEGYTPTEPQLN